MAARRVKFRVSESLEKALRAPLLLFIVVGVQNSY